MPRAARRLHLPIFFLTIFFFSQFFFPGQFFALCNYIWIWVHAEASKLHTYSVEALEAKKNQNHTSPHYSLMQPQAASMEADVKEIPMLILNILLKWPIIAKLLLASGLQPQAASREFGSDGKTSRFLIPITKF